MDKLPRGIKVLSIGNSFSEDATAFLHDMAAADGVEVNCVNPFIGGCLLARHFENISTNAVAYDNELNGEGTDERVSMNDMLKAESWDFVTVQQGSAHSGMKETYFPYLADIVEYIGKTAPSAKIFLHETWSYETGSTHEAFENYGCSEQTMLSGIKQAYSLASQQLGLPVIPCGEIIQLLRSGAPFDLANGGIPLCRDGFHMNELYGRYALSATWYEFMLGGDIMKNTFVPRVDGVETDERIIEHIKKTVHCFLK